MPAENISTFGKLGKFISDTSSERLAAIRDALRREKTFL
jgi:hypothetical protein